RHALILTRSSTQSGPAAILDITTGTTTPLLTTTVTEVRYAAGYIIYVLRTGTLQAAPFDLAHRRVTGAGAGIGTGVSITGLGSAQLALARQRQHHTSRQRA